MVSSDKKQAPVNLLPYGNEKLAAMGIVMKVNLIAVFVLVGFAFGAQPLIGYNYGANRNSGCYCKRDCHVVTLVLYCR